MPVKEFKGTLDKPKVKEFSGSLDKELYGRQLPELRALPDDSPVPEQADSAGGARGLIGMFTDEMPGFQMPNPQGNPAHRKYIMGGIGTMMPGGIVAQSLLGAAGYGAGALADDASLEEAATEGAVFGAGALAGGLAFKALGALAGKAFTVAPEEQALNFAKERGAPYLDPRAQIGRSTLPGDLALRGKAKQAVAEINRSMAEVTKGINSLEMADDAVDVAAAGARAVLDDFLSPGAMGIKEPLQKIRTTLGDDFMVDTPALKGSLLEAKDWLQKQGITTGPISQKINTMLKKLDESPRSLDDLDELYGDFWRLWNTKSNRSTRKAVETVTSGIVQDIDEAALRAGYQNFGDDFATALATRAEFRELAKKYPEFKKLMNISPEKTRIWMSTMFNSSGEALRELQRLAPDKYDDLANAYLARNMYERTKESAFGRTLDGKAFAEWVSAEKATLKNVFGERFKSIEGLSKYAESVSKTTKNMQSMRPEEFMARAAGEIAGVKFVPGITIATEAGSFVLAKGLTNPNSWIFKLATEGAPGTSKALQELGRFGGGAAAAEMSP